MGIPATQCEHVTAAYMNFTIDSLEVKGNYDRVYCYASIEGAPEQRLPVDKDEFFGNFQMSQLWGDYFQVEISGEGFTIPYPDDGEIGIEGECMAWSGASLHSLGHYSADLKTDKNGSVDPLLIDEPNFKLVVSVTPAGLHDPVSMYSTSNPLIEGPVNLQIQTPATGSTLTTQPTSAFPGIGVGKKMRLKDSPSTWMIIPSNWLSLTSGLYVSPHHRNADRILNLKLQQTCQMA